MGGRIDEVSDVPRTRHLGAGRYLTVGLDSKEWVGCGMLFVGYQHRGSRAVAVHEAPKGKVCQGWVAGQDAAMGTPDTPSQVAGV